MLADRTSLFFRRLVCLTLLAAPAVLLGGCSDELNCAETATCPPAVRCDGGVQCNDRESGAPTDTAIADAGDEKDVSIIDAERDRDASTDSDVSADLPATDRVLDASRSDAPIDVSFDRETDAGRLSDVLNDAAFDAEIPDSPTCTNECTLNTTQCALGVVQTCQTQSSGCARWATTVTCKSHQTCVATGGSAICQCNASSS